MIYIVYLKPIPETEISMKVMSDPSKCQNLLPTQCLYDERFSNSLRILCYYYILLCTIIEIYILMFYFWFMFSLWYCSDNYEFNASFLLILISYIINVLCLL